MKGYLVEYTTPYTKVEREIFVPADQYVPFLTCVGNHNAEVTAALLTENVSEDVPVADTESFGWVARVGETDNGKVIFIPDGHLNDVADTIRLNGTNLTLLRWTNKIVFDTDLI